VSPVVARPIVAWLTLLAIAGTLCACGRYGPPKRTSTDTAAASTPSDSGVPPSPTSDSVNDDDEEDGKHGDERKN
jgi:predicted small lipoprotein YifL